MAIWGTSAPKFIYDNGGGSEATVLLDYVVITKNAPSYSYIEHVAEIEGSKEFHKKGKHWAFELKMNLFKYASPVAKYDEIVAYEGLLVDLWQHRDGDAFQDSGSDNVLFILKEVIPFNLNQYEWKDGLILKFESTEFIDLSQGTTPVIDASDIIMEAKIT